MEEIGHWLSRVLPTAPPDLLDARALWPLWRRHCPPGLAGLRVLGYCRGRLFVAVPSSAFAARLRQEQPALIPALREEAPLAALTAIIVRPWAPPVAVGAPSSARPIRTAAAGPCVAALAVAVSDADLRSSLDRLARTLDDAQGRTAEDTPTP
ncbi:MAG: DciA family protein [Acidiferrobacter sp.]